MSYILKNTMSQNSRLLRHVMGHAQCYLRAVYARGLERNAKNENK